MKLLFIQSDPFTWTGKMSISAVLKKAGHDCDLLIEPAEKNLIESIKKINPDIIGISATTGAHLWALEKAKEIKEQLKLPVIFGGAHATFFPEVINDKNVDIICRGEGEYPTLELLDCMAQKKDITKIKNLWVKEGGKIHKNEIMPLIQDLDSLPFPDREIYYKYDFLRSQKSKDFIFMRGCPYNCSFCYNHSFRKLHGEKEKYVRYKSVNRAIEEILYVKNKWGMKNMMTFDEAMFINKEWLFSFLEQYKKQVNLPFICEARANLLDEETVRRLKEADCTCVRIGVETGSNSLRNDVLNKNLTNEQIENAARLLKKEKILLETYNMIGLPRETLEDAFETLRFNKKIRADYAWCALFQPYPGTDLANLAIREGFLDKDFMENFEPSFLTSTPMKLEHKKEIINLQKFFAMAVRFPIIIPFLKLLIKAPNNKFYDLIFRAGYIYLTLKTTDIGFIGLYKLGRLTGNYFKRKKQKNN
jgi:radical SAM superfamily enzyme YgiQ (UPF0313 family)